MEDEEDPQVSVAIEDAEDSEDRGFPSVHRAIRDADASGDSAAYAAASEILQSIRSKVCIYHDSAQIHRSRLEEIGARYSFAMIVLAVIATILQAILQLVGSVQVSALIGMIASALIGFISQCHKNEDLGNKLVKINEASLLLSQGLKTLKGEVDFSDKDNTLFADLVSVYKTAIPHSGTRHALEKEVGKRRLKTAAMEAKNDEKMQEVKKGKYDIGDDRDSVQISSPAPRIGLSAADPLHTATSAELAAFYRLRDTKV